MKFLGLLFALFASSVSHAQTATIGAVQGSAAVSPGGDSEWFDLTPRRGLRAGDRVWTDRASRVQLRAGDHRVRLDARTQAGIESLRREATQISLRRGSLAADVGPLASRENFEVGTPNLAFRATSAGRYRIDVDLQRGVTQVAVIEGAATVFGERGDSRALQAGERMTFAGRSLGPAGAATAQHPDEFDRWQPRS